MIKAQFEFDEDRGLVKLTLKGHAGMSTVGNDVICSAASILAYTVGQTVKTAYEMGKLKYKPTIKLKSGDALISCRAKADFLDEMIHTFLVVQTGYRLLASRYPNFVKLKMFGEPEEA